MLLAAVDWMAVGALVVSCLTLLYTVYARKIERRRKVRVSAAWVWESLTEGGEREECLRIHVYNDSAKDVHVERAGTVHKDGTQLVAGAARGFPFSLSDGEPGDGFIVPIPETLTEHGRPVSVWVAIAGRTKPFKGPYPKSDPSSVGGTASTEF